MKCDEVQNRLVDVLVDDLDPRLRADIEAHLAHCPSCSAELRSLGETWTKLGVLPQERPSSRLRTRFYAMLDAELRNTSAAPRLGWRRRAASPFGGLWAGRPALQWGLALALLVVGLFTGAWLGRLGRGGSAGVTALHQEVQDMRRVLAASLLKQPSPFDRLQGVSLSRELAAPGQDLLQSLLQILDSDPNVNVQLAAVDALYLFSDRPGVKDHILASLSKPNSPLVQAALVDLLVGIRERRAVESLRLLLRDKNLNPQLKQKVLKGIEQLSA